MMNDRKDSRSLKIPYMADGRIAAIDGINAIMTLEIALIFHFEHFPVPEFTSYALFKYLEIFYRYGYLAVEMFSILSGFKMCALYGNISGGGERLFSNIKKRLFRLWPLYVLVTVMTEALQLIYYDAFGRFFLHESSSLSDMALNLVGANGLIFPYAVTIIGPAWTIPFQMACYVLFFILIKYTKGRDGKVIYCSVGFCFAAMTARHLHMNIPVFSYAASRMFLGFFIGVLLCKFQDGSAISQQTVCISIWLIFCGTVLAVKRFGAAILGDIDLYASLVILPGILLLCLNSKILKWMLNWRIFNVAAKASYSMYLIHFPITILLAYVVEKRGYVVTGESLKLFILRSVMIIAATVLTYFGLERPIGRRLRKCARHP